MSHLPAHPAAGAPRAERDARYHVGPWARLLLTVALPVVTVAAVTGLGQLMPDAVAQRTVAMLYLLAVLASALAGGLAASLATAALAFLAYNLIFIEPRWTLAVGSGDGLLALAIFVGVAAIAGTLAAGARERAEELRRNARSAEALLDLSARLGRATGLDSVLSTVATRIAATFECEAVLLLPDSEGKLAVKIAVAPGTTLEHSAIRQAQAVFEGNTRTPPDARARGRFWFMPLRSAHRVLGVVGLRSQSADLVRPEDERTLSAMLDQAAIAIDRAHWIRESARTAIQRERDRLQSALLSSLSHDLRTPLASITGAITSLRELGDRMPAETRDDLMLSVEEEAARLTRFVTNLFDTTRIEAGTLRARREAIDIPALLSGAIQAARALHPGLVVDTSLAPDLQPARGDAALLHQVLFNLLDNAHKYGDPTLPVSVFARSEGGEVTIAVIDQGKGIPPRDLERIFERFYRRTRGDGRPAGTGLGLSIARGFLEAMGGTIVAESPASRRRGTRFVIRLPAAPGAEPNP